MFSWRTNKKNYRHVKNEECNIDASLEFKVEVIEAELRGKYQSKFRILLIKKEYFYSSIIIRVDLWFIYNIASSSNGCGSLDNSVFFCFQVCQGFYRGIFHKNVGVKMAFHLQ